MVSQSITLFGSTLSQMAIVWYLTLETFSGRWVAAATVCCTLPQGLLSFAGGALADRYSKRRLILLSDGGIAGLTLLALPFAGGQDPLVLLALLCLRSLGAGIQTPAANALLPQLVPPGRRLTWNGYWASCQAVAQLAAPAAAGLVMTWFPLPAALAADLITAALGMGLLARLSLPDGPGKSTSPTSGTYRSVLAHRETRRVLMVYSLFILLSVPAGYLAQLLVARRYGASYGVLTAVELVGFGGMVLGGLALGRLAPSGGSWRVLGLTLAGFGGLSAVMGWGIAFPLYLLLMVLFGVFLTAVQTTATTLLQGLTPPDRLGKAFGLFTACYAGALPLGMGIFGPLADLLPLSWLMTAAGLVLLAAAGKILGTTSQNVL